MIGRGRYQLVVENRETSFRRKEGIMDCKSLKVHLLGKLRERYRVEREGGVGM